MLDYVLHVQTLTEASLTNPRCDTLLVDDSTNGKLPALDDNWHLVWTGKRSPDAHEQFQLYVRKPSNIDATEVASRRRQLRHKSGKAHHIRRTA